MCKLYSDSVELITLELRFRKPTLFIYCILDSLIGLWRSSPISLCIFNKLNPFSVVLYVCPPSKYSIKLFSISTDRYSFN